MIDFEHSIHDILDGKGDTISGFLEEVYINRHKIIPVDIKTYKDTSPTYRFIYDNTLMLCYKFKDMYHYEIFFQRYSINSLLHKKSNSKILNYVSTLTFSDKIYDFSGDDKNYRNNPVYKNLLRTLKIKKILCND